GQDHRASRLGISGSSCARTLSRGRKRAPIALAAGAAPGCALAPFTSQNRSRLAKGVPGRATSAGCLAQLCQSPAPAFFSLAPLQRLAGSTSGGRVLRHKAYRGRLAPSPTGHLHLGHARTFWIAQERAQAQGGTL